MVVERFGRREGKRKDVVEGLERRVWRGLMEGVE